MKGDKDRFFSAGFEGYISKPIVDEQALLDEIDRVIAWNNTADVGSLAGQPRRLRFVLNNADLYSFQFLSEE